MPFKLCCNPYNLTRHSRNLPTRKVTKTVISQAMKIRNLQQLSTENHICDTCRKRISKDAIEEVSDTTSSQTTAEESDTESADIIQIEENEAILQANQVIGACGLSPLNKRKLGSTTYGEKKIQRVSSILSNVIQIPDPSIPSSSGISFIKHELDSWISNLKEAFKKETKQSQRIYLLTTLPASWSQKRIEVEFEVSRYTSRQVKQLVAAKGHYSYPDPIKGNPLSDDVKGRILEYYYDNEVSRILPGMKDTVSVREGAIKVKKTKRLMLLNLKEAYHKYKQKNEDDRVGFSKFAMERPRECVLPGASGTHSVCVCITHQNANLMYSSVSNLVQPSDTEEVLKYIMCNVENYDCCSSICSVCNTKLDDFIAEIQSKLGEQATEEIRCHMWTQQDRCSLEEIIKSTEEFLEILKGLLAKLKLHSFTAKRQSEYLRERKENVCQGEYVIICDFAENYLFLTQEEVQSSHWNNQQVTIFPMVIYYKKNDQLKHVSFAMISEELKHTTNQVYLFQKKLINFLNYNSEIFPAPTKFTYFSDGSPAQFKNKKNFVNICNHKGDFNIKAEWVFFATAHGKGAADGVGGTIKRLARAESLRTFNRARFSNACDLFNWAKDNIPGIHFGYASIEEHKKEESQLRSRFNNTNVFHGTQKIHHVIPSDDEPHTILCKPYSNCKESHFKTHSLK